MIDLPTAAGAIIAVSACASGVCAAVAYRVPPHLKASHLKDCATHAVERLEELIDRHTPPAHKPD